MNRKICEHGSHGLDGFYFTTERHSVHGGISYDCRGGFQTRPCLLYFFIIDLFFCDNIANFA